MLKTLPLNGQSNNTCGCVMLLGGFDGLHAGHKTLVARAKEYRLPIAIMTIVGGKQGESLFTGEERTEIFSSAGVDILFELPFLEIKDYTPEEFACLLEKKFAPKAFICGDDFRFGKMAVGTPETLKSITQVPVEVVELLQKDGEKISSTTVKKYLSQGDVVRANALLGERFFLLGEVVKDREVGRTIGFPTANVAYPNGKFPLKKGVYETRATIGGKTYKGITNYGARPTFNDENVLTETFFDGFSGDLYGEKIKIEFVRYLRDIRKFDGVEGLKAQLETDLTEVRSHD
ncbi:MAG: riboflavin biosynthesis protein RibF [Clostridiales bacterium]|nr:riboflavin biosynthesis protein RibF [Clostridiales bacterium]